MRPRRLTSPVMRAASGAGVGWIDGDVGHGPAFQFKNPDGHSSWKLVNDAGLKGRRIGGAMVSELHTNFIINAGGASSADIRELIETIRETVYTKYGVTLEPEIRLIGEF